MIVEWAGVNFGSLVMFSLDFSCGKITDRVGQELGWLRTVGAVIS